MGLCSTHFMINMTYALGPNIKNKIVACVCSLLQILIKYDVYVCQWKCVLLYMQERES